jgi:hypothetical protein
MLQILFAPRQVITLLHPKPGPGRQRFSKSLKLFTAYASA